MLINNILLYLHMDIYNFLLQNPIASKVFRAIGMPSQMELDIYTNYYQLTKQNPWWGKSKCVRIVARTHDKKKEYIYYCINKLESVINPKLMQDEK